MRQFAIGTQYPPQFTHLEKALCGPHCVKFMLEARGEKWTASWPTTHVPTFPERMVRMLKWNNQRGYVEHVPRESRIAWLNDRIMFEETPALFVRAQRQIPFPLHWVVACGMNEGKFFIYDDRIGLSSYNPNLPAGNTVWTDYELLELWQAAPLFRRTSTAIVTF